MSVQTQYYCPDCNENHFGNCPKIKTFITASTSPHPQPNKPDGADSVDRLIKERQRVAIWYANNKERVAERIRLRRQTKPDEVHKVDRSQREKHKEKRAADIKKWYQSETGRASKAASTIRMNEKYPEKNKARIALRNAVRLGKVTKAACHCGEAKVQGHHYLGYEPEHWLSVQWLCHKHHVEAHYGKR